MRHNINISILLGLTLFLSVIAHAETGSAPEVLVQPKRIGPGDIALITVKDFVGTVEGSFNGQQLHFNPFQNSYQAVVGIDLNAEPGTYPLQLEISGHQIRKKITIAKKKYPVQRLTLPEGMVVLSPENEARVEREQKRTTAIWPVDSLRIWRGSFIDPLPGKEVGTPFGVRRIINKIPKSSHSGVDITADEGEPVRAPNDGVVVLVDDLFYSGNSVILDHGQGIYTMFFHLSRATVRSGQAVMKGDVIAFVGSTGRSTGAHLHWGVRMQGAKVDPLGLIKIKLE